ncbi:MAG TPA: zinc-dependent metalloprotease [Usitatibacter sp.]|nr:zinc-dependent metalloprotease [Usitatibacter sp.]
MKASLRRAALASAVAFAFGAFAQGPAPTPPPGPAPAPQPQPPGPGPTPPGPAPQVSPATAAVVSVPTTLPGTPQTSPAIPAAKPFAEVVKGAKELPGYFNLYEKEEKVWMELKPDQFDKPYYLSINRTRGLGENFIFPFMVKGYIVEFHKIGPLVQMFAKNQRYGAKEGTPLALAAAQSFTDSLLGSATVASQPDPKSHAVLIEANGLFLADIAADSTQLEAAYRAPYSFDQRNSSFEKVRATPDMATFQVSAHFAIPRIPAPPQTVNPANPPVPLPQTLEDVRSMFLGYHYSLAKLPDTPMTTRVADPRVGHFTTRHNEYTTDLAPFPRQYFVNRWRLEKKDPGAELSEPKQPIVFWMDRNVPVEYRDTVKAGILEWNKAFERIGFKDAIHVEMQPDDAEFDTADLRHASVRWYLDTSDGALAIGPSRIDPRTGEILDADIGVSQGWTRLPRRLAGEQFPRPMPKPSIPGADSDDSLCMYGEQAMQEAMFAEGLLESRGEIDPNGPEAEAIIKATLKDVITHEVGHTLGLRHNFRASTVYTEKELADPEFTRKNGISGSVMDYNAWNIALDKDKQGEYVMSTLGPYDYWAIEYAYKTLPAAEEKQDLARIASRSSDPKLAYATDDETGDSMDPSVNLRDLGSDPLVFAKKRMQLSRELWDRWQTRKLPADESREVLYRNVVSGFTQYALASQVASKYVGGVVYVRDYAGSDRPSFTPVDPARQREALKVVTDGLFQADSFKFKPEFLARVAGDPFEQGPGERANFTLASRVLQVQTSTLDRLMSDAVASRLLDSGLKLGDQKKALSLSDLYDNLQGAIWSELRTGGDISLMRRNLQREYVKRMTLILTRGNATGPADARALERENAKTLITAIHSAQGRPGLSKEARAHLADSANTLDEALKAPMMRMG